MNTASNYQKWNISNLSTARKIIPLGPLQGFVLRLELQILLLAAQLLKHANRLETYFRSEDRPLPMP